MKGEENKWRLERIDGESSESGFEGWNILRLDPNGTDALAVLQAWDEAEARHILMALRWYDSFQEGDVSIPVPPLVRKRTRKIKVKEDE